MKRREFIAGLGGAVALPLAARAQQGDRIRRIGILITLNENDPIWKLCLSTFTQALADLGWTNGRNLRMYVHNALADVDRMQALAKALVGVEPDVIVADTTPATAALQRETRTIPIVFVEVGDSVGSRLVAGLNRPGGNITGFALFEASLGGKWLELLSEIAPGLKRVAIMFNPDTSPANSRLPQMGAESVLVFSHRKKGTRFQRPTGQGWAPIGPKGGPRDPIELGGLMARWAPRGLRGCSD